MNIIKPCFVLLDLSKLAAELRSFLIRLVGVAPQGSFLTHVRLTEMLDTGLGLLHLFWGHALEGLHAVLVHVDGELVHEVLGLYVGSISIQDMAVGSVVHLHLFFRALTTTYAVASSLSLHVLLSLLLLFHAHC